MPLCPAGAPTFTFCDRYPEICEWLLRRRVLPFPPRGPLPGPLPFDDRRMMRQMFELLQEEAEGGGGGCSCGGHD